MYVEKTTRPLAPSEALRRPTGLSKLVAELEPKFTAGMVFVGMAFDGPSQLSDTYKAIKDACEANDLAPFRADEIPDAGPIQMQILKAIEDAQFLIFDLTHERPNVYYEMGYAHGIGNILDNVVLTAHQDADIHFDVGHMRIMNYLSAVDLQGKLTNRLQKMKTAWSSKPGWPPSTSQIE